MDEEHSRRSLSPYHEKCFPPYCDNAQQVDKAALSKMTRSDLEDKYIIFADENLALKKQVRNHERQIQRLQTSIARQDYLDKRSGRTPTSAVTNLNKIDILEAQNKNLQAKVKVLKQQLMNHSFIHSKESRIADAKCKQSKHLRDGVSSEFPIRDVSHTQSAREAKPDRNVTALKLRIGELEDALEAQKNKYKDRIAQLEKELAALEKEATKSGTSVNEQLSEHSRKVNDNKEMIRLRMQAEKQAAELAALQERFEDAEAEIEKLNKDLEEAKERADDLETQLEKERNRSREALSHVTKSVSHSETIRALEEQIRDLQNELQTLRDTNEKLLQLTQSKSEKSLRSQASDLRPRISQLEQALKEKMEELEQKEQQICDLENELRKLKEQLLQQPQSTGMRAQPSDLELKVSELEQALKEKMKELEQKEKQIGDLQDELQKLKDMHEQLLQQAESKSEKSLRTQPSDLRPKVSQLEQALKEKIEELEQKGERIRDLEDKVSDLEQKLKELEEKAVQPTKEASPVEQQAKLESESKSHQELLEENEALRQQLDIVSAYSKPECVQCVDLSKRLCGSLMENQKLKFALEEAQREKTPPPSIASPAVSQTEINDLKREIARLQQSYEDLNNDHGQLKADYDHLKKENSRLEEELNAALEGIKELKQIIADYENAPVQAKAPTPLSSKAPSETELNNLRAEIERLEKELAKLKEEKPVLEQKLAEALDELYTLRPIAEEHEACRKTPVPSHHSIKPTTSSKSVQHPSHPPTPATLSTHSVQHPSHPPTPTALSTHSVQHPSHPPTPAALSTHSVQHPPEALSTHSVHTQTHSTPPSVHSAHYSSHPPTMSAHSVHTQTHSTPPSVHSVKYPSRPTPIPSSVHSDNYSSHPPSAMGIHSVQCPSHPPTEIVMSAHSAKYPSHSPTPTPSSVHADKYSSHPPSAMGIHSVQCPSHPPTETVMSASSVKYPSRPATPTPSSVHSDKYSSHPPSAMGIHSVQCPSPPTETVMSAHSVKDPSRPTTPTPSSVHSARYPSHSPTPTPSSVHSDKYSSHPPSGMGIHSVQCPSHPPTEIVMSSHSVQYPSPPHTEAPSIKEPSVHPSVSFREPSVHQIVSEHTIHSESGHSKNTVESDRYIDLNRQLQQALWENEKLRKALEDRDADEALRRENQRLEGELIKARSELKELIPIVNEHKYCPVHKEYIVEEIKPPSTHKEILSPYLSPIHSGKVSEHVSYKVKQEQRTLRWPDTKSVILSAKETSHSESLQIKSPSTQTEPQISSGKSIKEEKSKLLRSSEKVLEEQTKQSLAPVVVKRLLRRRAPLHTPAPPSSPPNSPPKGENEEEEPRFAQPEVISAYSMPTTVSYSTSEVRRQPINVTLSDRVNKALLKFERREDILKHFFDQEYVSHVSPPPSIHCAETVPLNDPAQRANMLIVSQHDFETVLMKKKRYSTEVEVVEPVDGRQTLNCKLEICMYDLEIDERLQEYLSSIQPDPKVYVEWSFVGLDQRTAPMPAEQALFYTNVVYYGPLSQEIKKYLKGADMPVDLYLVKSSGNPIKVAQGSLDMLPAMEQPNRGFMRSVFLRGKDLPSRYATDRAVATIHCSFILHECCLGDPPFKDQIEVAIGTLYLKNRDGGVVPDHATHIYIEYSLLGHCGPELETDSVPRGEVMKFNHSKKLRVNDDNIAHLKDMLKEENPRPLRFTVLAEPCNLLSESEVETVGYADVNLREEMINKDRDMVSSQVPVYSNDGEHLGSLSVTVMGISTLQHYSEKQRA